MNDPIKAKIIAAVPEIVTRTCPCLFSDAHPNKPCPNGRSIYRPITLADVLRAFTLLSVPDVELGICGMPSAAGLVITSKRARFKEQRGAALWLLSKDYDGQTQEVKEFIGSLLSV